MSDEKTREEWAAAYEKGALASKGEAAERCAPSEHPKWDESGLCVLCHSYVGPPAPAQPQAEASSR